MNTTFRVRGTVDQQRLCQRELVELFNLQQTDSKLLHKMGILTIPATLFKMSKIHKALKQKRRGSEYHVRWPGRPRSAERARGRRELTPPALASGSPRPCARETSDSRVDLVFQITRHLNKKTLNHPPQGARLSLSLSLSRSFARVGLALSLSLSLSERSISAN